MRLACCRGEKQISVDFDEQDRITTYDGLESCILNSCSYDDDSSTSRADGCATDSLDESDSISSSSKDASGSFSSQWLVSKHDEHGPDEWEEVAKSPQHFYFKQKLEETVQYSDVETMKERFSKLLLGEDVTGGQLGLCTALTLSNAITKLAASIFGELWKLEPLPKDRKCRWRGEMDWLLSPTNYMVELVPAKQNGTDGRILEIMTPKTRSDIHMNLPALQKLDSMLIETLDSMVNTEFWYAEGGSRAEGRSTRQSKRWWLPSPRVPMSGLSISARKKLVNQGRVVQQVFKAAKTINSNVLLEMPVPTCIRDAIPKSGKANLGEQLYSILSMDLSSEEKILAYLDLKSEHIVLQTMNQLETALFAWKQRVTDQVQGKSPGRNSWSFVKDTVSELDKTEILFERAEALLQLLKSRFPNLPQTFLDVTRIKNNKDVGHSILEAYSRVIGNVAFRILSRVRDILQEDDLSNPNSPISTCCFSGINPYGSAEGRETAGNNVKRSLLDRLKKVDKPYCNSDLLKASELDSSDGEPNTNSVTATLSRSRATRVWCINRKACSSLSPRCPP